MAGKEIDVGEVALQEDRVRLEPGKRFPDPGDGDGIAVDPDQPATRLYALEQCAGVPSASQGRVNDDRPRSGLKELY